MRIARHPPAGRPKPAVVLLSGGLDSATTLAWARSRGFECHALTVWYGQRHAVEVRAARGLARRLGAASHRVLRLDLRAIGGSALTAPIAVPKRRSPGAIALGGIPATYVPARNTIFLALALGLAEVVGARDIFLGINALDYSGYPDCRPEFLRAFRRLARLATRAGVEGRPIAIHAPLIRMSKAQIVNTAVRLGVPIDKTISCYDPDRRGRGCGECDACRLRAKGIEEAGL